MKPEPHSGVRAWLNAQAIETLFLSSVSLAELLFGVAAMPSGRRKDGKSMALDGLLELFGSRIVSFDADAARCYAELAASARSKGKGFPLPDGYIAATAAAKGFMVATRDIGPFEAAGLSVINPWEA
jgi:toxin FitB